MKKNINKLLVIGSMFFLLTSCSEERFNLLPNDQDTPESIFTTEANYRTALDGAYDYLKDGYSGDTGNMLVIGDALADNLIFSNQGRKTNKKAYEWTFTAEDASVTSFYSEQYRVISRANFVLDNLSKVPYTEFMKNIEAEAKAIRAIAHFDIARAYAKIPTQSADAKNSLGIAYVTVFDPSLKTTRDITVADTYAKIVKDLEDATMNINNDNGIGRLGKAAIYGYLSKVNLYLGNWDKVIEYGEKSIALKPSVGNINEFSNIWTDASQDGVLFTVLNSEINSDNIGIGTGFNQNIRGITSEFYANYELVKSYKDTDIRKNSYITKAENNGTLYNHVTKYSGRGKDHKASIVNVKLLRTADIYLGLAEAYAKSSNEAKALELLNTLRKQRYSDHQDGNETGNELLKAILEERRLELAFENDRFWTLKRLGEGVNRSDYGSDVDGGGVDAPKGNLKTLPASSHRFVLPIPASAIRLNPNNLKQNPQY